MTSDDLDIEALLDAPFKTNTPAPPPPDSYKDVIDRAKRESQDRVDSPRRDDDKDNRKSHHRSRYRSRSKSRSRSRDRYHSDESRRHHRKYDGKDRQSSRNDVDDRRRRDSPSRRISREGSYSSGSLPDSEVVLTEAQRDRRTVFVRQLAQRVRSPDLKEFCEKAGRVRDVKLVCDRISGRSRGVAYVEFYEESSVQKAIDLTGEKLAGIPIIIELTETEKNRLAEEAAEAARLEKLGAARAAQGENGSAGGSTAKIFVGGLHPHLGETELRKVFEPFGDIEFINLSRESTDSSGPSKGFGYIQFKNAADAKMAVEQMNGFELAGRPIRVGIMKDRVDGPSSSYARLECSSINLDDSETAGLTLNAKTRTELMMKLSRDPTMLPKPAVPQASQTILLTRMYDPEEETELHWEYAISDEVRDECNKYGPVVHLSVQKTKGGEVYVKFRTVAGAQAAIQALNGRWFGGRQIGACFVRPEEYARLFPSA